MLPGGGRVAGVDGAAVTVLRWWVAGRGCRDKALRGWCGQLAEVEVRSTRARGGWPSVLAVRAGGGSHGSQQLNVGSGAPCKARW
jgi:hypothetical protein